MLEMPQRSVTRFFIPMIDVLTLLFCIFLLLPMVEAPADADAADRPPDAEPDLKADAGEEARARLREELEKLRKEKGEALKQRLAVRVLEIDDRTGRLYYRNASGERVEVRNHADARALTDADARELIDRAPAAPSKELYYLILYPRDPRSAYPTRQQRENYDGWFAGVVVGYDIPGSGPGRGP